jgi:hypothetical protein
MLHQAALVVVLVYRALRILSLLNRTRSGNPVMFRILVVPVLVVLALCGCSKTDDGKTPKVKDSVAGPTADAAAHTEIAPQDRDVSAENEVTDAAAKTKNAAAKPMKAKKGSGQMRDAHSSTANDWRNFQVVVNKCDTATAAESKQCLMKARDTYRAWNLNCDTLAPEDKAQCTRYIDRWTSALADAPHANTPAVRSGEPNTIPADPGDPSDKERNRDSTKQQAATPQPSKEN